MSSRNLVWEIRWREYSMCLGCLFLVQDAFLFLMRDQKDLFLLYVAYNLYKTWDYGMFFLCYCYIYENGNPFLQRTAFCFPLVIVKEMQRYLYLVHYDAIIVQMCQQFQKSVVCPVVHLQARVMHCMHLPLVFQ